MGLELTPDNFEEEVIHSSVPVLVDFWAPWCAPCLAIAPHLEDLAKYYGDKIKVCKLNIDKAQAIATKYTIMSIPALVVFKDGKIMGKKVGMMQKEDLKKFMFAYSG